MHPLPLITYDMSFAVTVNSVHDNSALTPILWMSVRLREQYSFKFISYRRVDDALRVLQIVAAVCGQRNDRSSLVSSTITVHNMKSLTTPQLRYVGCDEIGHFLCSVISQGKVVALDRWGGKWNHLPITHRLTTIYAKNYCNRTLIVKIIIENVVTCFWDIVYKLICSRS